MKYLSTYKLFSLNESVGYKTYITRNLVLYHGTEEHYEGIPDESSGLVGFYTTTEKFIASDYGKIIYQIIPKTDIKIMDLSDGGDLFRFIIEHKLLEFNVLYSYAEEDKEEYLDELEFRCDGYLWHFDLEHGSGYVDRVVDKCESMGYDLVKVSDYLGGADEQNIAWIIINKSKFNFTII